MYYPFLCKVFGHKWSSWFTNSLGSVRTCLRKGCVAYNIEREQKIDEEFCDKLCPLPFRGEFRDGVIEVECDYEELECPFKAKEK